MSERCLVHGTEMHYDARSGFEVCSKCELEQPAPATAAATPMVSGDTSDGYHTFNELYEHRHALFSVICAAFDGWKAQFHEDGTMFDGWFIAGVNTPLGMATYHLPIAWWGRFRCTARKLAPKWDGHTAQQVPERIASLVVPGITVAVAGK